MCKNQTFFAKLNLRIKTIKFYLNLRSYMAKHMCFANKLKSAFKSNIVFLSKGKGVPTEKLIEVDIHAK